MSGEEQEPASFLHMWKIVWQHISRRRKRQLAVLACLTIAATFAEMVSIALVLPFLALLAAPEQLFENEQARPWLEWLSFADSSSLLLPLTFFFLVSVIVSSVLRLAMTAGQSRLSHAIGSDLAVEMFERTIYQPYAVHAATNSSRAMAVIINKSVKMVTGLILPTLMIIGSGTLLLTVTITLLAIAPVLALSLMGAIAVVYGSVLLTLRARLRHNGTVIRDEARRVVQILQEGFGGIRDVLLDNAQAMHVLRLAKSVRPLRQATADNVILSAAPRFLIETVSMIAFAVVGYVLAQEPGGVMAALPILGTLAIAAQRLLPVAQQCYSAWTNIRGSGPGIEECLTYLELPYPPVRASKVTPLPFDREIRFAGVEFSYGENEPVVLKQLDLVIPRGTRIGIIGSTGSGKSTTADILMGLITPTGGHLLVDGTAVDDSNRPAWQSHIAHVPQAIFLADASVAENVAFGIPREEIDHELVRDAIARAQLTDTVERLPQGIETKVGERGVRLSGGQRQRLGIARTLYRRADVIVFDEATSALDGETEERVMQAIDALDEDLTIIMIAHRLSTLRNCDTIIELDKGVVVRSGSPETIIARQTA